MKVALASSYRLWMLALFPTTLGVGTVALWWRSLDWPLRIDADGVTLRHHRRLPWNAISRIGVSRSYLDGHLCEMRIHHHGTISRIPVRRLRDGEEVAGAILTMFKRTRGTRQSGTATDLEPIRDETPLAGPDHVAAQDSPDEPSTRRTNECVSRLVNSNGDCR
jgi:hypothetical protein